MTATEARGGGVPDARLVGVIPAYNAAATVAAVARGARRHLARVIVVDDGSTDGTAAVAAGAGAEVLRHDTNRGKGAALMTAFDSLLGRRGAVPGGAFDAAITLDADGQHDPDDIPLLIERYRRDRPAILVGSRAAYFARMRGPRRAMNGLSSAALRLFCRTDLPDSQCGFRVYDAAFLAHLRPRGLRYETEMEAIMQAASRRLPVAAVDIHLPVIDGRPTSHYRPFADTMRIIRSVLSHWLRHRWLRRPPPGR